LWQQILAIAFYTNPKGVSAKIRVTMAQSNSRQSHCLLGTSDPDTTPTLHLSPMDIYTGNESDDFLARRGAIRRPSRGLPHPYVGSHPRVVASLTDRELDNLVLEAFDCNDTEDTFRGLLRKAVDGIKPDVLTSLCAYRIGFEGNDATELSLLVTVCPGSLTRSQAIQAIVELSAILER
jgi:hypothetical protein